MNDFDSNAQGPGVWVEKSMDLLSVNVQGEMEEFLSSEQSLFHDEIIPKNIWIAFHSLYKSMKKIEWD